ncbi:arylamine N-acetyltransferase [Nocardioides sp.]|uniref:arylamine N-acetyltransferase family protein n=1 Tax=Nocardioides sp. TaxID=35761 RepID=UPI0027179D72|nr:arylamine N-acetyltransferase [Nocardioides sp.]MDO9455055.1 arylamine N-acetyltransferase [Nocardioides sp.]
MTTAAYLERLGLDADLPPTVESLVAIHRAHVTRVPYENLGIMLGRPPSVVPVDSLARVADVGRAGYCFHQNGSLETALRELGYAVERRHGHVWTLPEHRDQPELNHLVLVVTGLPTDTNPGGRWSPDVGLGEGPLDPLPLVDGDVVDGPFRFALSDVSDAGWSFANDPTGSFTGLEVRDRPTGHDVVVPAHAALSTPPTGAFTKVLVVQRRDPLGSDTVRGCVATRIDADGVDRRDLTTYDGWRGALDAIGLPLGDVGDDELHALFDRMLAAHRAWDAEGRP